MRSEDAFLLLIFAFTVVIFIAFASFGKPIDFLLEFSAGVLGVFFGFSLERIRERGKNEQNRKDLLRDLHNELEEIRGKLTGKGHLHFPDIWDSAVSSGQIRLFSSEQVTKLTSVYRDVKRLEYEAKRVRDLSEEYRLAKAKGPVPNDVFYLWNRYSKTQIEREKKLRAKIEELLEEKWWA